MEEDVGLPAGLKNAKDLVDEAGFVRGEHQDPTRDDDVEGVGGILQVFRICEQEGCRDVVIPEETRGKLEGDWGRIDRRHLGTMTSKLEGIQADSAP